MNHFRFAIAAFLFSAPVIFAQNDRSWVSSTGSDTNSCTRLQPCATFQGALAKTNSPGEIDVVDPGEYGAVVITSHTVTIDGGGMARILIPGAKNSGIWVQSGSVANIRNLTIRQLGAGQGFGIHVSGTANIENVTISNLNVIGSNFAIGLDGAARATVSTSTLQDANYCVYSQGTLTVDHSLLTRCNIGVQANLGGTVLIRQNVITGNTTGLSALSGGAIVSFKNNGVHGNTTDGSPTTTISEE